MRFGIIEENFFCLGKSNPYFPDTILMEAEMREQKGYLYVKYRYFYKGISWKSILLLPEKNRK